MPPGNEDDQQQQAQDTQEPQLLQQQDGSVQQQSQSQQQTSSSQSSQQQTQQSGSLVDLVVSGDEARDRVGGILCNDPSGLCMSARGSLDTSGNIANSGVYTNLIRLASQLQGGKSSEGHAQQAQSNHHHQQEAQSSLQQNDQQNHQKQQQQQSQQQQAQHQGGPLVTIEYDDSAILVKEYDGHVVAVRVPSAKRAASAVLRQENGGNLVGVGTGEDGKSNGATSNT